MTGAKDVAGAKAGTVIAGASVTVYYTVTNTGDVVLSNITVTDDQGVTVDCTQSSLVPGSSMTCSGSGTAVAGQYANVGTATGGSPKGTSVMDADPSHYYGEAKSQGKVSPGIPLLLLED